MKKLPAFLIAGVFCVLATACGNTTPKMSSTSSSEAISSEATSSPSSSASYSDSALEDSSSEEDVGSWIRAESPVISEEMQARLAEALEELEDRTCVPLAYLGSQQVYGTNHAFLCRGTQTGKEKKEKKETKETYGIAFLFEAPSGEFWISDYMDSDKETGTGDDADSWTLADSPEVPTELHERVKEAVAENTGADVWPLALAATQPASGTNYCVLCEMTPPVPDPEISFALAYIQLDPDSKTSLTDLVSFTSIHTQGIETPEIAVEEDA